MSKVTVYSTPTCPWCKKTKEFLNKNYILFTDKNVGNDLLARAELQDLTHAMSVPVIVIDGQVVVGYDEVNLQRLLGIK
jgi:glutaredoxin-like YruB-family protein